jgi:hypothetical protein
VSQVTGSVRPICTSTFRGAAWPSGLNIRIVSNARSLSGRRLSGIGFSVTS